MLDCTIGLAISLLIARVRGDKWFPLDFLKRRSLLPWKSQALGIHVEVKVKSRPLILETMILFWSGKTHNWWRRMVEIDLGEAEVGSFDGLLRCTGWWMVSYEVPDGLGRCLKSALELWWAYNPYDVHSLFFPGSKITFFINFRNRHNIFIA